VRNIGSPQLICQASILSVRGRGSSIDGSRTAPGSTPGRVLSSSSTRRHAIATISPLPTRGNADREEFEDHRVADDIQDRDHCDPLEMRRAGQVDVSAANMTSKRY